MSKNFEMMQQAVAEPLSIPSSRLDTTFQPLEKENRRLTGLDLDALAEEEALKLVQRIFLAQPTESPRVVVFTAVDRGNGCSRICAQTAKALASSISGSVCLVDANFRSPSLPRLLGVPDQQGLADALSSDSPIFGLVSQLRPSNLWLLSCGAVSSDSPNLLNSDQLRTRLAELRMRYDYVLIDAPPLNQYRDAAALAQIADGTVLVLEANSTRRESALAGIETLHAAQVRILGAVLNKRTFPIPESLYRKL